MDSEYYLINRAHTLRNEGPWETTTIIELLGKKTLKNIHIRWESDSGYFSNKLPCSCKLLFYYNYISLISLCLPHFTVCFISKVWLKCKCKNPAKAECHLINVILTSSLLALWVFTQSRELKCDYFIFMQTQSDFWTPLYFYCQDRCCFICVKILAIVVKYPQNFAAIIWKIFARLPINSITKFLNSQVPLNPNYLLLDQYYKHHCENLTHKIMWLGEGWTG